MAEKIANIVSQLTLEEKAGLCSGLDFWHTKAVERLGIPSVMVSDGPHGLRKQAGSQTDHLGIASSVTATCFPTAVGVGSSWNRELLTKLGGAIANECQAEDVAVVLGPGVNIKRSPLCGRNFEYFSEDPYHAGEMGVAHVNGVQANGVGTSLKHFAINNQETRRMGVDAVVDERTAMEIYLAAFEPVVKRAQPWTVMNSYNRINGVFACQNEWLLTDVLRTSWGFEGFVVTDWGAMDKRVPALKAGCELEMPSSGGSRDKQIVDAVKSGDLDEAVLDRAVTRYLNILFRWLDTRRPDTVIDFDGHHALARKAAGETMVLAKNKNDLLPFESGSYAVIGAPAQEILYQGGGSSHINSYKVDNFIEELGKLTSDEITFEQGYKMDGSADEALIASAVAAAQKAKNVVVMLTLTTKGVTEGYDRDDLKLSSNQDKLVKAVLAVRPDTAVVVVSGSAVELPWADKADAILVAHLGGQAAAGAIADILTGAVNPSAKFAETWPLALEHNPSHLNFPGKESVVYSEGIYVGYRYYEKKNLPVLFPFGYGLSYTSFAYSNLKVDRSAMKEDETLNVYVDVENTGKVDGQEIIQLYVSDIESYVDRPLKELKGFEKVSLKAGEKKSVQFKLDRRAFAYWDTSTHDWTVETGAFEILVGPSSDSTPLSARVTVESLHRPVQIFDEYTPLKYIMGSPAGQQIVMGMFAKMGEGLGISLDPEAGLPEGMDQGALGGMDLMAMMADMPLKTMASFAGGAFTDEMMYGLLAQLNSQN